MSAQQHSVPYKRDVELGFFVFWQNTIILALIFGRVQLFINNSWMTLSTLVLRRTFKCTDLFVHVNAEHHILITDWSKTS